MNATLIAALRWEEEALLADLLGNVKYRRLQEIRRLLALYETQPPIGAALDALIDGAQAAPPPGIPCPPQARAEEAAA